ncbi:MAG TPA: bifunctional precorrin-2 dehydrogenase/sirohydrochlorin ferrochelatase [Caulobacteraceae bacterium]|nr:bifunctional precorrin-2 dehydrogenase/sirohydrochlorin ferrochelatase [Caulobacteraceae bacterium]
MEAFPAFFPLSGRRVVIAGEGEGAEAKARLLAGSPATVERVTGAAALAPDAYAGAALAFIASPNADFCEAASLAARGAGVPTNVADHPELSDFHTPAIIDRGQMVAAIGTAGAAPIVAALVRAELEAKLPAGLGRLVELFGKLRAETRAALPDLAQRRAFLRAMMGGVVAEAAEAGDLETAERLMRAALAEGVVTLGVVWLIQTPEARDLISLRAARALAEADTLVLGHGVATDVAVLGRRDAPRRTLAETDAGFLADEAAQGRQTAVVADLDALTDLALALGGKARHHMLVPAPDA